MRVLVCGGRDFDDWQLFIDSMNDLSEEYDWDNNQPTIIEGGAKGADFCARLYAKYCGWHYEEWAADWTRHGKSAGVIRNSQMLIEGKPDMVVAFPGGNGTAHMVRIAKEAKIKVIEVKDV